MRGEGQSLLEIGARWGHCLAFLCRCHRKELVATRPIVRKRDMQRARSLPAGFVEPVEGMKAGLEVKGERFQKRDEGECWKAKLGGRALAESNLGADFGTGHIQAKSIIGLEATLKLF